MSHVQTVFRDVISLKGASMRGILRTILAGYGARKLTGGCGCGAILVFLLLYYLLGYVL
jgi:hypothetical protein